MSTQVNMESERSTGAPTKSAFKREQYSAQDKILTPTGESEHVIGEPSISNECPPCVRSANLK